MSSNFKYTAGLHNVGSYLVSGFPYVTSSTIAADTEVQISFPTVAKSITVIGSSSNDAAIAFNASSAGRDQAGGHYIEVDDDDSFTFNVRCKEIYISCSSGVSNGGYQVFAELTSIPAARIPDGFFTGSGLTD